MKLIGNITIFLLLLGNIELFAVQFNAQQQHQIDSLNRIIKNPQTEDTTLVSAYVSLSEILLNFNIDTLYYLTDKAQKIASQQLQNPKLSAQEKAFFLKMKGKILNHLGYYYNHTGNSDSAFYYYNQALKFYLSRNDTNNINVSLNNISHYYYKSGKLQTAIDDIKLALKYIPESDYQRLGNTYSNLAGYCYYSGRINEAIEYFNISLKYKEKTGNKLDLAHSYVNLGYVYHLQKEDSVAQRLILRAISLYKEVNNPRGVGYGYETFYTTLKNVSKDSLLNVLRMALKYYKQAGQEMQLTNIYANLGKLFNAKGNLDSAKFYLEKAYELAQKSQDQFDLLIVHKNMAELYVKKNEFSKAYQLAFYAYQLAEKVKSPFYISQTAGLLAKILETQGKCNESLKYYKLHMQMH
ncbi:MAG: tetratricopeptide repeat protein, partial [Bacteroidetes bacterium]